MTPAFWADLAIVAAALIAAPLLCGVLLGFLIHWLLELRDLRRAERGTLPR